MTKGEQARLRLGLVVPASWIEVKREDGFEFVSPDRSFQLILSVLPFKAAADSVARKSALQQLVSARQAAFQKMSRMSGPLLSVENSEDDRVAVTALVGADVAARVLIYSRVIVASIRAVTASVYRYGKVDDVAGFTKVAEEICKTIDLSSQ
jgi:hypothetical protein